MSVRQSCARLLRTGFKMAGYDLVKRRYKPYGVDPYLDIARFAPRTDTSVTTCFDVGANEGQSARAMLELFPEAQIWSFEPVPVVFETLRQGAPEQVHARNLALGSSEREAIMHTYSTSLVSSLEEHAPFTDRYEGDATGVPCRVTTLDAFCAEESVSHIDVLKIDTEGHDLEVLRGARGMLARGAVDFILVEFNAIYRSQPASGTVLEEIAALVAPLGYMAIAFYTDSVHLGAMPFFVANVLFARETLVRQARS